MAQVSPMKSDLVSPKKPMTPTSKQTYLVQCWSKFINMYLPLYNNKDLKFEDLAGFLRKKDNTGLFIKIWKLIHSTMNNNRYNKKILSKDIRDARMILSSLMIYHFPVDMLDENDTNNFKSILSKCVYNSAFELIKYLINKQNIDQNPKQSIQTLYKLINKFLDDFKNWQQKDIQKLLDSLKHVYREWVKSHKVMRITELHESKKDAVLNTLKSSKNNVKQKMIKLVGQEKADEICESIEIEVSNEPEILLINSPKSQKKNDSMDVDETKDNEQKQETIKEKLASKGVPMNIKTGHNLVKQLPNKNNDNNNDNNNKYIQEYKGKTVLNLDKIIADVASKKYWDDFASQIEQNKFERLFELLKELLERIKKISPKKSHKMLDDLIDVKFIEKTISNGLLDAKGFYGIFYGIHTQLKAIHAPINDKIWDEWHDKIVNDMGKSDQSWAKLLPIVFNKFLMKIDEIEDQINAIKAVKNKNKTK